MENMDQDQMALEDIIKLYFNSNQISLFQATPGGTQPDRNATAIDGDFFLPPETVANTQLLGRLVTFLLSNLAEEPRNLDRRLLTLGCATEVFKLASANQKTLLEPGLGGTLELFSGVHSAIIQTTNGANRHLKFLQQKCVAAGLGCFPLLLFRYRLVEDVDVGDQIGIASSLLRHYQTKIDGDFVKSLVTRVLHTTPVEQSVMINFLSTCATYGQGQIVSDCFLQNWNVLEKFLDRIFHSSDAVSKLDFTSLLDNLFDYALDLSILSQHKIPQVYQKISEWTIAHMEWVFSTEADGFTGVTTENRSQDCRCTSKSRPCLMILKSICVNARQTTLPEMSNTVAVVLAYTMEALRRNCEAHQRCLVPQHLCSLFAKDDEGLCCALLCCLHLSVLMPSLDVLPSPESCFDSLLDLISNDHYVFISWITDNQNCFLAYFLQYLRYLDPARLSSSQNCVLSKVAASIEHLFADGKVAFNPAPLLRRLKLVTKPE